VPTPNCGAFTSSSYSTRISPDYGRGAFFFIREESSPQTWNAYHVSGTTTTVKAIFSKVPGGYIPVFQNNTWNLASINNGLYVFDGGKISSTLATDLKGQISNLYPVSYVYESRDTSNRYLFKYRKADNLYTIAWYSSSSSWGVIKSGIKSVNRVFKDTNGQVWITYTLEDNTRSLAKLTGTTMTDVITGQTQIDSPLTGSDRFYTSTKQKHFNYDTWVHMYDSVAKEHLFYNCTKDKSVVMADPTAMQWLSRWTVTAPPFSGEQWLRVIYRDIDDPATGQDTDNLHYLFTTRIDNL